MSLPPFTTETESAIRERMLGRVSIHWDKSQGSFVWDAMNPQAIELAKIYENMNYFYEKGFVMYQTGAYLDESGAEIGLTRIPAKYTEGIVEITATAGTYIPAGTTFATETVGGTKPVYFQTVSDLTVDTQPEQVLVRCTEIGTIGNVPATTVKVLVSKVSGIASVTNPALFDTGVDTETDAHFQERILERKRRPATSGNKNHYVQWVKEYNPLYDAKTVPLWDGKGTVKVVVIDDDKLPVTQAEADAIQAVIAPKIVGTYQAEDMTASGYGVTTDGTARKLVYSASGQGDVREGISSKLSQCGGIWKVKVRVKVSSVAGSADLLTIFVYDTVNSVNLMTTKGGSTPASVTRKANQLSTDYMDVEVPFYWDGLTPINLYIRRLVTDTTTTVWVDSYTLESTFSSPNGEGLAPIGAMVTVAPAQAVTVNVSATLTVEAGKDPVAVKNAVSVAITDYIKSLAFEDENDVLYTQVGKAILMTPGVRDYANLLLNGATANVSVADTQVAVVGTVTLA